MEKTRKSQRFEEWIEKMMEGQEDDNLEIPDCSGIDIDIDYSHSH
tara:strand:- start:6472 stop:6606 length:135 start_codon:yes stop_codon:yes gene_type:complete